MLHRLTNISRARLSCGKHLCPEKCHPLVDHSKMHCSAKVEATCRNKHQIRRECWRVLQPCPKCERDSNLKQIRKRKQDEYLSKLIAIEDQIALQRGIVQDFEDHTVRTTALKQKEDELATATRSAQLQKNAQLQKDVQLKKGQQGQGETAIDTNTTDPSTSSLLELSNSKAAQTWESQKSAFCAENEHIDAIMKLVGLESIKEQVLWVKDKVDISLRQGANLSLERFNALFLGNPGTGRSHTVHLIAALTILQVRRQSQDITLNV